MTRLAFLRRLRRLEQVFEMIDLGVLLQVFDARESEKSGEVPHCLSIEDV